MKSSTSYVVTIGARFSTEGVRDFNHNHKTLQEAMDFALRVKMRVRQGDLGYAASLLGRRPSSFWLQGIVETTITSKVIPLP